jgi:Fumarylacetoacetate (FAA) hydrolase family
MILLQLKTDQGLHLGAKTPQGVLDLMAAHAEASSHEGHDAIPASLAEVYAGGTAALAALERFVQQQLAGGEVAGRRWLHDVSSVKVGPCVANPGKIICVGLNYRRHALESGQAIPTTPVLFSKFSNTLAASDERVVLPLVATEYDYEAELGVIIGQRAQDVRVDEALQYVLGYCAVNDLSARPAGPHQPVAFGQDPRSVPSNRSLPGHGRYSRRPAGAGHPLLGKRRTAPELFHWRHDLLCRRTGKLHQRLHDAGTR